MGSRRNKIGQYDGFVVFKDVRDLLWFNELVESIEPWTPKVGSNNSLVWIRLTGISLNTWSADCFKRILATLWSLIVVDDGTETRVRSDLGLIFMYGFH